MFNNIGSKIKTLAQALCWIGIGASIVAAIAIIDKTDEGGIALIVIVTGTLLSWIGSFFAYGFGELIEKATEIAQNSKFMNTSTDKIAYTASQPTGNEEQDDKTVHKWRCDSCGNMISEMPCKFCGNSQ